MQNDNDFTAATAVDDGLHAERTYAVNVPDEMVALLRSLASTIGTATYDLMNVECTDIAARGRVVAKLAEAQDLLDARLGIKKRKTTVLALNDLVFDVFIFLGRKELDMLQVVNRRFNDVIDSKMTLVCLRHLACAEIVPSVEEQQFLLGFEALQSFAELKCVHVVTRGDCTDIWDFLIRNCFKISSSYVGSGRNLVDGWWDAATAMDRLMEFCFDPCDERYATNERNFSLRLKFIPSDFLETWVQYAEAVDCLHQLTLSLEYICGMQDLTELEAYERPSESNLDEGVRWRSTLESISGRRWLAVFEENDYYRTWWMQLKINH